MRKILITGGAGFIGSHVVDHFAAQYPSAELVVLDKMTYAADYRNIEGLTENERLRIVFGDVCDLDLCRELTSYCDMVIHVAAESHVDASFENSMLFTKSNVLGTHALMEACRQSKVERIVHVSTDEIYGEVLEGDCEEGTPPNPTNPYSASKAAAELIVRGYIHSFKLPVVMIRGNNVFGVRQYPEKLIPRSCLSLLTGEKIPLHGDGRNRRHFLAVEDIASAIGLVSEAGEVGEVYNVGSVEEYENIEIASMVCDVAGVKFEDSVEFIQDRPFNDRRYAINWDRIRFLGWAPTRRLEDELPKIFSWYADNLSRYTRDLHPEHTDLVRQVASFQRRVS